MGKRKGERERERENISKGLTKWHRKIKSFGYIRGAMVCTERRKYKPISIGNVHTKNKLLSYISLLQNHMYLH